MPKDGDLTGWAKQGVLLLNATLTVRQANAGSHQKKGWEEFTDAVIRAINDKHEHVVFMLWGSYAQKKGEFIDRKKHLVIGIKTFGDRRIYFFIGDVPAATEFLGYPYL